MAAGRALLDDVLAAIEAGDPQRVLETLESMSEAQRRRSAPKLRAQQEALRGPHLLNPWRAPPSPQRIAAATACIATGTPRMITRLFEPLGDPTAVDPDLAGRAVAARGREFANAVVDRLLDLDRRAAVFQARAWSLLRRLVASDAADRPQDTRYIAMMISSVATPPGRDPDRSYRALAEDPALLETEVWQLFELDVVIELDQARVWDGTTRPGAGGENAWIRAIVRLSAEGRLGRARLLDASLAALDRDFRASAIAWHGRLHEALRPTLVERADRISGYASLLSSPTPPVVRFALAALAEIDTQIPVDVLVRAAPGPLSLREKRYAFQMLGLLERALVRDATARTELLCAAAHGLAHARPDVQERTLELLERDRALVTRSVEIRSVILGFADTVAPTVRDRLDDLLGFSPRQSRTEPDCTAPVAPEPVIPCATARPIADVDELIEVAAACLEGDASAEELERFFDGLSALWSSRDDDIRRRAAGVVGRARKVLATRRGPGLASAEITATALCSWLDGKTEPPARTTPVANQISSPTPSLTPRIEYYMDWRNVRIVGHPEASAALLALVRAPHRIHLANGCSFAGALSNRRITDDDLRAVGLPDPDEVRRTAGDPVLVFDAAPGDVDPAVQWLTALYRDPDARGYKRELIWAADRGGARWLMSRHRARIDVFFAIAATNAYLFRDDNIVYGFGDIVLERALDPLVRLGTTGWFAVGSALMVKAADIRRLAGDVVAATIADGRFDPRGLADAFGLLVREGATNLRRVTETLRDISRASRAHAAQLLRLIEALLPQIDPKAASLHDPLELALELATDLDLSVADDDTRAALSEIVDRMSRSSKASRSAQRLLDL